MDRPRRRDATRTLPKSLLFPGSSLLLKGGDRAAIRESPAAQGFVRLREAELLFFSCYLQETAAPVLQCKRQTRPYDSSFRTIAAPSASAFSFPNATSRARYFIPQSGAGIRRSGATCFRPARMRSATCSGRSTIWSPRLITPSMIFFDDRSFSTPRSMLGCADSIEICCAFESASSERKKYEVGLLLTRNA